MKGRPEHLGGFEQASVLTSDPEVMGGRPVFRGTRIPVDVLFENLADGISLDQILVTYPGLRREDAIAAIMMAKERLKNCT
jgi:uncharacterized protein (DUF433 family)